MVGLNWGTPETGKGTRQWELKIQVENDTKMWTGKLKNIFCVLQTCYTVPLKGKKTVIFSVLKNILSS